MIKIVAILIILTQFAVAAEPTGPSGAPPEGILRHLSFLKHYSDDPNETLVVVRNLTNDLHASVKQGTARARFGDEVALTESIRIIRMVADDYANDLNLNPQTRGGDIKALRNAADELAVWQTGLKPPSSGQVAGPAGTPPAPGGPPAPRRREPDPQEMKSALADPGLDPKLQARVLVWVKRVIAGLEGKDEQAFLAAWLGTTGEGNQFMVPEQGQMEAKCLFADPVAKEEQLVVFKSILSAPQTLHRAKDLHGPGKTVFGMVVAVSASTAGVSGPSLVRILMKDEAGAVFWFSGQIPAPLKKVFREELVEDERRLLDTYLETVSAACKVGNIDLVADAWLANCRLDAGSPIKTKLVEQITAYGVQDVRLVLALAADASRPWKRYANKRFGLYHLGIPGATWNAVFDIEISEHGEGLLYISFLSSPDKKRISIDNRGLPRLGK